MGSGQLSRYAPSSKPSAVQVWKRASILASLTGAEEPLVVCTTGASRNAISQLGTASGRSKRLASGPEPAGCSGASQRATNGTPSERTSAPSSPPTRNSTKEPSDPSDPLVTAWYSDGTVAAVLALVGGRA